MPKQWPSLTCSQQLNLKGSQGYTLSLTCWMQASDVLLVSLSSITSATSSNKYTRTTILVSLLAAARESSTIVESSGSSFHLFSLGRVNLASGWVFSIVCKCSFFNLYMVEVFTGLIEFSNHSVENRTRSIFYRFPY